MDYQTKLRDLKPFHEFFIGIDSDGCVFDTMEVKQKEFFIPNALKYFGLCEIEKELRETWEFVNLYSVHRGGNRFTSILKVFELLKEREATPGKRLILPDVTQLQKWVKTETKLSNANLRKFYESCKDPELEKIVQWTEAVNKDITENIRSIPPFPNARKAIGIMSQFADLIIVSQTPLEALEREWEEHNLRSFVNEIAGQEYGTKTEHIALSAVNKYPSDKILMIGDARGDLVAARNNGILFYPIIPGHEDGSWLRLISEGFDMFSKGCFRGEYENELIGEFEKYLPLMPPWQTS